MAYRVFIAGCHHSAQLRYTEGRSLGPFGPAWRRPTRPVFRLKSCVMREINTSSRAEEGLQSRSHGDSCPTRGFAALDSNALGLHGCLCVCGLARLLVIIADRMLRCMQGDLSVRLFADQGADCPIRSRQDSRCFQQARPMLIFFSQTSLVDGSCLRPSDFRCWQRAPATAVAQILRHLEFGVHGGAGDWICDRPDLYVPWRESPQVGYLL